MIEPIKQNRLLLTFEDQELEKEFKTYYGHGTRLFIRIGVALSIVAWTGIIVLNRYVIPQHFIFLSIIISIFTYPFFISLIIFTYKDRYLGHYQWMAAVANGIAGLLVIYYAPYLSAKYADYSILVGILIVLFFGYYILRLRFLYASIVSFVYMGSYQVYLILFGTVETGLIFVLSYIIWLMFGSAVFAGHIQEAINRQLFVQRKIIKKQQEEIQLEHQRAEELLLNILPQPIAQRLKKDKSIIADSFEGASVLFADIVSFTALSENFEATEIVQALNDLFSIFDDLTEKYGLEKIKTIGDAYMVAGGLPEVQDNHAEAIADFALEIQEKTIIFSAEQNRFFDIRIGIHTGKAVAGVIGKKKFIYDIWGDTVNTASRMESHGIPGEIHVTEQIYNLLRDKYSFVDRGEIEVKGKGLMKTYFLKERKTDFKA
jgi:adenylate cyclase